MLNNKDILQKLYTIRNTYDVKTIESLINEFTTRIQHEENPTPGSKQAIAALKKVLTSKYTKTRPALQCFALQEVPTLGGSFWCCTDSFQAYYLHSNYSFLTIDDYNTQKNTALNYPDIARFVPDASYAIECVELDYNKTLKALKTIAPDADGKRLFAIGSTWIQCDYIENAFKILKADKLNAYRFGDLKPVLLENENAKEYAILLPVRKYS